MELTLEEKVKVTRLTSSFIGKLCTGGALALKGTGYALEKSTGLTATALHFTANGIDAIGKVTSGACYAGATALENKAKDNDLSEITDEQIASVIA